MKWLGISFLMASALLFADDLLILKKENQIIKGKILELTEEGVQFEVRGARTFFKNEDIVPQNLFEHHQKKTNIKDPQSVEKLAETAVRLELYSDATRLFEQLMVLNPDSAEAIKTRLQEIQQLAAENLFEKAQELENDGELEKAQKIYQSLMKQYPDNAYKSQIDEALKNIATLQEEALKEKEQEKKVAGQDAAKAKEDAKLAKAQKYLVTVEDLIKKGNASNVEALEFHGKGNISQANKKYEGALLFYKNAITGLVSAKKYATTEDLKKKLQDLYKDIRQRQVNVYNSMATMVMADKNWKKADALLKLALKIDPTNAESLRLKAEVDKNRVTFSAAQRSNAKPIISNQ